MLLISRFDVCMRVLAHRSHVVAPFCRVSLLVLIGSLVFYKFYCFCVFFICSFYFLLFADICVRIMYTLGKRYTV